MPRRQGMDQGATLISLANKFSWMSASTGRYSQSTQRYWNASLLFPNLIP